MAIHAAFGDAQATQLQTAQGPVNVDVIYPPTDRQSLRDILEVPIRASGGRPIAVGEFASLRSAPAPNVITRTNRTDVVHVDANVGDGLNSRT